MKCVYIYFVSDQGAPSFQVGIKIYIGDILGFALTT